MFPKLVHLNPVQVIYKKVLDVLKWKKRSRNFFSYQLPLSGKTFSPRPSVCLLNNHEGAMKQKNQSSV